MRIKTLCTALGSLALILLPETALMAVSANINVGTTCFIPGLPCNLAGSVGFATYVEQVLFIQGARTVFWAAAIVLFAQYGIRLMLESGEESTISEVKSAYTYGIAGCVFITLAQMIVGVVGQNTSGGFLVNAGALTTTLGTVVHFIRILVGTAVTGVVVYQGMRMIVLQGQESELEKQKTRFFHTLIGVAVITLASAVVGDFTEANGSSDLAIQMVGIANFLMVLIGGIAVFAFIVAGIMLMVSADDALKDRAKKTMFTTVIGLIVLIATFTIVNFVMILNQPGLIRYA